MNSDVVNDRTEPADTALDLQELFYSRTDKRGVIAAGNRTFQRISGFEWDQLIGAPHKVVRNHDTPRAVFRVMWDKLKRDEPVVAYVRNLTASGQGYWVIATVFPLADGYLSVRIKPTSAFFAQIRPIYAALSDAERNHGLSVDDSTASLLAQIATMGFADYDAFAIHAITQEFRERCIAVTPRLRAYFADLDRIRASLSEVFQLQDDLLSSVTQLRDLPTNMRIIASRIEPSGGPLSAMSNIYSATSALLFAEINDFARGSASIAKGGLKSFEIANFVKICALLQAETESVSRGDRLTDAGFDAMAELEILHDLMVSLRDQEKVAMQEAKRAALKLSAVSNDLRRSMLGLDTIRIMGLVESGRLGADGSRIAATMEQIGHHHDKIIGVLQKIKDAAATVNSGIAGLSMHFTQKKALAAN